MPEASAPASLVPLLEAVYKRPGMFLGAPSTELGLWATFWRLWSEFLTAENVR